MASIKVAVRVRPVSNRELNLTGSEIVVRAEQHGISLTNLKVSSSKAGDSRERTKRYGFDYCFDSSDPEAENYADQAKVYETLGQRVLDSIFAGYNSCLVAYGQTASGKTYTMMGTKDEPGLTPRLCEGLFAKIEEERKNERVYRVSVSYLEIYNERVRDLLKPSIGSTGLRVREHPRLGPYVQGLTHHVVTTLGALMSYVEEGTKARKTASTLQNPTSSRSHALLTIAILEDSISVAASGSSGTCVQSSCGETASSTSTRKRKDGAQRAGSKLHLVDLAGSESAATCSGVHRLKEGANINKSLVALGNVISALAERGSTGSGPGRRFIPYRDSSLTWLLKDALGGNATTIMLATISPASGSYNETAHTLRFAQRAQSVVNRPVVNEDPVGRIIRELKAEVARLKSLLLEKSIESDTKNPCSCKGLRATDASDAITDREDQAITIANVDEHEEGKREKEGGTAVRRSNSSESIIGSGTVQRVPRRFGSFEGLSRSDRFLGNYRRAKVTELNDEDEISEINESVFVDIPTLVAVLIKPDNNLQECSAQIEEICSDEVAEDSIDVEFIESGNDNEPYDDTEKAGSLDQDDHSSSVNSCHAVGDADLAESYLLDNSTESVSRLSETGSSGTGRLFKQDSIDAIRPVLSTNLHTSRKFGSVEIIQRKKEVPVALERSHTNLEKRAVVQERGKKLNNIREIDDQKDKGRAGSLWRGSGNFGSEELQRNGSNDSDRSSKDSSSASKLKNHARKPSLENLKRKTSKDSSSSSSKDEQILVPGLVKEKLLRRKSSVEQEPSPSRAHTPIQRTKRAEIVAAVTERLYSSRKHIEDSVGSTSSGVRSPPEGTADVKGPLSSKNKLQELSRKMLAKRRRVCADTQTDLLRTVRMKDTASLTELECQDVAVLTDSHEGCDFSGRRIPTLRVKDMATLTEKPKTTIIRCKDVASLANDLEDCEFEVHSPRNDSGILSDDTQNYAESSFSGAEVFDLCSDSERRTAYTESSTNTTLLVPSHNFAAQTPLQDMARQQMAAESKALLCGRDCCKSLHHSNRDVLRDEDSGVRVPAIVEVPSLSESREPQRNLANLQAPRTQVPSVQVSNTETSRVQVPNLQAATVPMTSIPLANPEKNVVSISLPDMISITIESTNVLESRVAVMDTIDHSEERMKIITRDCESQTEEQSRLEAENRFCFKDFTRSTLSQTEGRVFRIENIFKDPKNGSKDYGRNEATSGTQENGPVKNSFTFTNSLGTSYMTSVKENGSESEKERLEGTNLYCELSKSRSFAKDGLITEAFITKKRSFSLKPGCSQSLVHEQPWKNWTIYCPVNSVQCIDYRREREVLPTTWQLQNNQLLVNGLALSCRNCAIPLTVESSPRLQAPRDSSLIKLDGLAPLSSTPSSTIIETNNMLDHDYNFSDDSLDYNINNVLNKPTSSSAKGEEEKVEEEETRESLCPPDVVAHTKKESSKSSASAENSTESVESNLMADFEDGRVELPKIKPNDSSSGQSVHDYKTLILGETNLKLSESLLQEEQNAGVRSNHVSSVTRKKVSFSSTSSPVKGKADRFEELREAGSKETSKLKPIIKKKSIDSVEQEDTVHSSNDDTDDSLQEDKRNFISKNDHPKHSGTSKAKGSSSDETSGARDSPDSGGSCCKFEESNRKKVKFSAEDPSEDTCSESDSYGNIEDDDEEEEEDEEEEDEEEEEEVLSRRSTRNILEEYLDEAVTFMRNMNSINEYMSTTKTFERYLGRARKRGNRPRRISTACHSDYVEFQGRKISLKDDTDKYLEKQKGEEEEEIVIPTASYDRCLKSIQRLEDCIQRADKQNELLREKYGIDCESASAKLSLASPPSIDPATIDHRQLITDRNCNYSVLSTEEVDLANNNADERKPASIQEEEDLEKRIFDQLMNVADSTRYYPLRRFRQNRLLRSTSIGSRSPTSNHVYRDRFSETPDDILIENGDSYGRTHFDSLESFDLPDTSDARKATNYHISGTGFPSEKFTDSIYFERGKCEDSKMFNLVGSRKSTGSPRMRGDWMDSEGCARPGDFLISVEETRRWSTRERNQEVVEDECSRRIRDATSPKMSLLSKVDSPDVESLPADPIMGSADTIGGGIVHFRDKLKYPGSPRARFLELLRERRRIVESSKANGAS